MTRIVLAPLAGAGVEAAGQLSAGTVSVLLVGIAGPGGPDESGPEAITAAMARLEVIVAETAAGHGGVLAPQRDGSLLVAAFPAAAGAVACALDLQRAPVAAAGLRVCVYTGPAERDEDGIIGSAVSRAARLLGLAQGGQVLVSGAAGDVAGDGLPARGWLIWAATGWPIWAARRGYGSCAIPTGRPSSRRCGRWTPSRITCRCS